MNNYTSTSQMNVLQKVKHHLLVQRDGFTPLKYGNGEFIYKEKDRYLAGRGPLSEQEERAKKEHDEKISKEGSVAASKLLLSLIYLVIAVFAGLIFGAKVFLGLIVIGLFLVGAPILALIVFLIGVLMLI